MQDGLLLVDKDPGGTSHDVVQRVRRLFKQKKVGHCGTLDPDATGLLLLTLGAATRLTRFLIRAPKVYEGTLRLGIATDTYDATGRVVAEVPAGRVTTAEVAAAMHGFEGTSEQQPPPYSAKKVGGVKYYELARRGEEVPQETKEVTVFEFRPLGELSDPEAGGARSLRFLLSCSSGTYARSLAHDVGQALGCGGHLAALRRTQIGPFEAASALPLAALEERMAAGVGPGDAWVPFDQIPLPFGEVTADPQQEQRIHHGQTVLVRELAGEEGDWVKLLNRRRELIAVGTVVERIGGGGVGVVQPKIVFR
ncbi:MAG: tRNA pseudouridine(55) synthase TruB [Thermoanaerobaculia bacterium]